MTKDYLKREPTKTERVLYDLAMHQEMMDRNLASNSAFIMALGLLSQADPKKIAELMVNGTDKLKAYGEEINTAIKDLETAKQSTNQADESGNKKDV